MFLGVLRRPHATLESAGRERRVWAAARMVGLWALLNLLLTEAFVLGGLQDQLPEVSAVIRVFSPASAVVLPFVWWVGVAALTQLTIRLFGGEASLPSLLAVVGVACAPWVLGYAVQLPVGLAQLFLQEGALSSGLGTLSFISSLAALAWHAVLVVIGISLAAGTDYRAAGGSCALTGLGCATAGFVLGLTIFTLVFTLSG